MLKSTNFTLMIEMPIRIYSEANLSEHWTKKHKRKRIQQFLVKRYYESANLGPYRLPVAITLTRMGQKLLDDDNLASGFKYVRDAIADCILPGLPPGKADEKGMKFIYKQQQQKQYAVRIEIEELK